VPLCVALLAFAGVGLYQLRIRQVKQKYDLVLAERGRIARELHDTLIQGFSGITIQMQALMGRLPDDSRERKTLSEIVADAGSAMREARRSLMGLRSHDSSSAGLAAAVEQTTRQLAESNGIKLKLSLSECDVPADVEYNLVRIAQEAVTNAIKHSGARTLRVTLNRTPTQLLLAVKDDGTGFDNTGASPAGHFGLIGMKERAAQIGATFQISSEPGQGTTVSVLMES
jgi:signal transduction histidine kinase